MASNYTTNYELPIWAADDAFLRTEFNEAHEKIEDALTGLENKFYVGTYDCDGTYGANHPITLTFPFQPRALYLGALNQGMYSSGWYGYGMPQGYVQYNSSNSGHGTVNFAWNGQSVSFYSDQSANAQYNYAGGRTLYIAVK